MGNFNETALELHVQPLLEETGPRFRAARPLARPKAKVQDWSQGNLCCLDNCQRVR